MCVAEAKERERERETETETETERQTEREAGRQAGSQEGRQRQTQTENVICYYNLSILNATVYGRLLHGEIQISPHIIISRPVWKCTNAWHRYHDVHNDSAIMQDTVQSQTWEWESGQAYSYLSVSGSSCTSL